MPTLTTLRQPPDSNVTPERPVSSSHCYHLIEAASTNIYLAVAAVTILVVIRLAKLGFGSQQRALPWAPKSEFQAGRDGSGPECRKDSAASYSKRDSAVPSPSWEARDQRGVRLSFGRESHQFLRTAGPLSLSVGPGRQSTTSERAQAMDGIDRDRRKDHSGPSASATSRGVSTSSNPSTPRDQQNPPLSEARPVSPEGSRRRSRSPRSPPQPSPSRHLSGGSDGDSDKAFKGKGPMVGHHSWATRPRSPVLGAGSGSLLTDTSSALAGSAQYDALAALDPPTSNTFARPPPPPPLTPPALDTTASYPFEDRRRSYAVSIPPELDTSFMHQPNPDYASGSTSTDLFSSSPRSATATPRRRSYTRGIPIGIPGTAATASSSSETMIPADTFSPSSYPPTLPLLPPPPPGHEFPYEYQFVGGPGGPEIVGSYDEIVDVHGEIISVLDDAGHGWKRHTRVYGGGVCLACAAAGEEGGFYGDKVPLEDRRR